MFVAGAIVGFAMYIILLLRAIGLLTNHQGRAAAAAIIFALAFGALGWYCQIQVG